MSGSNGRQMLNSSLVSSTHASTASALTAGGKSVGRSLDRKHRKVSANSRIANNRRLLVENLERREMMASDTAAYYNPLISTDVNGDFSVTPLDALLVINALNSQAMSGVDLGNGVATPATGASSQMIDVNGDGNVSAIDALLVINQLNQGEGEIGILVGVQTQILSRTGVVQTPDSSGNYTLSAGEEFTLRVRGQDRRPPPPPSNADTAKGIFSFFVDIDYSTVGSPDTELAQVLWGETQRLSFSDNLTGGSFTLDFGGQSTGPIAIGLTSLGGVSSNGTINNIRNAVGALSFVGGVNNIDVTDVTSSSTPGQRVFQIRYIGPERRIDQANPVFVASGTNLTSTSGIVVTSVTTSTDPSQSVVFAPAVSYPSNAVVAGSGDPVVYRNSPSGRLVAAPGVGFILDDVGGIGTTGLPNFLGDDGPNTVVNIFDTAFRSSPSASGSVEFTFDVSGTPGKDILLLGSGAAIPAANIAFPAPFRVQFVQSIQANNVSSTVNEDSGANNIPVTATLVTGTGFTVESVTQPLPAAGTASFLPSSRTVVFTPAANYSGPASFTYTVISNLGDRSTANVSVSVTAVNDLPTIVPGVNLSVVEDAIVPLVITPSQIFSPGPLESTQAVTFGVPALVSGQTGATVARDGSGNITVTPVPNYFGPVVFTVTGTDNGINPANLSTTATITVNVTGVNDKPEANVLTYAVDEDPTTPFSIPASQLYRPGPTGVGAETTQTVVLSNVTAITAASAGTISLGSGGTSAVFNPTSNFFGQFLFTAVALDNGAPPETSIVSTFTINVRPINDAPTAVNDTNTAGFTISNIPGVVQQLDVMRNDSAGPSETTDTIRIVALGALTGTGASTSSISISTDGSRVLYTPAPGLFNVTQTFTYTIEDGGGLRATATASVFVAPPTLPFAVSDSLPLAEGAGATPIDVLFNDLFNPGETKRLISFMQPTIASDGVVALLDNGTPANLADDRLSFTPGVNFSGSTSFTYRMNDSRTGSVESVGTVNVSVNEVNDPPTVVNQSVTNGVEDIQLVVNSSILLAGSSAGPNESTQSLTITNATVTTANAGTVAVVSGNVVYTPAKDFNGQVLVTFTATDSGTPALSASATLTITVAPVNDAPIASGPSATSTTAEGVPLTIVGSTVVINDRPGPSTAVDEITGVNAQTVLLTNVSLADANAGTVSLVSGNVIYTPASFFNGEAVIAYTIADSGTPALTAQGQLRVRVTEVNNAPVPLNAARDAFASLPVSVNLSSELASASRGAPNESAQTLTITRVIRNTNTNPGSTIVLNSDGTISYTAPAGFSGQDTFSYEVRDNGTTNGVADSKLGIATVTMNIAPFQPSQLTGTVWIDDDTDGIIDTDEQRVSGVEVRLTGRSLGANSDIAPRTTRTLSTGLYSFEQLPPGTYKVFYVMPTLLNDAVGANEVTRVIVSPGGANFVSNFASVGIDYNQFAAGQIRNGASVVENLASSFYGTYPNIKQKGVVGLVRADGTSAWTSRRDGDMGDYASSIFTEIVLADDKKTAFLTTVDATGKVMTAPVPRKYLSVSEDIHGNSLVYVLARASELSFVQVQDRGSGSNGVPRVAARGYLQSVDQALADYDF